MKPWHIWDTRFYLTSDTCHPFDMWHTFDTLHLPPQVSDIHISSFRNYDIVPDFKGFIATSLAAIAPKVVMVTGDLTDAKSKSKFIQYRCKRILNLIFSITLTGYSGGY